ncbi:hypothetical protein AnigIFM63604_010480 [Aspergillus niger]|uniref:Arrestin-like N-terminal domain-containing protein n=1 Tax=Aspergillus niger TaxID=5061 RepID=A0A9W6A810_ASPNG|nr:hypothetical protein AnigIFM63604_010480 [Aspergillus niger]
MKWLTARPCAPKLTITIKNPKPIYTTWDRVEGTVTVTTHDETDFNNIKITFEGSSRVALPRPITELLEPTASHTFLKLQQPIESPISTKCTPGRHYTYPFCFVIPEDLPLGSCIHEKSNDHADHRHAKLPPTLRFANLSQELGRVAYFIRATVSHYFPDGKSERSTTFTREIRFVPAHQSDSFPSGLQNFISLQHNTEQQVKSTTLLPSGKLHVSGSSAKLLQKHCLESSPGNSFDTYISIPLRFEAVGKAKPPQLRKIHFTLNASTFLATKPSTKFLKPHETQYRQAHVEHIAMRSEDISSTQWVRHEPTDRTTEDKSEHHLYYTTSLIAPIRIQKNAHLIQSFSTCLLSRAYFLDVRITYSLPGTAGARQTLKATLPVDVAEPCDLYDSKPAMPLWDTLDELHSFNWDPDPPPYYGHEFSKHDNPLKKGHGNALSQYQVTS